MKETVVVYYIKIEVNIGCEIYHHSLLYKQQKWKDALRIKFLVFNEEKKEVQLSSFALMEELKDE